MKKIIIFLLLTSCTSTSVSKINTSQKVFNFDQDLSFVDFSKLLNKYANRKPYPNTDD